VKDDKFLTGYMRIQLCMSLVSYAVIH